MVDSVIALTDCDREKLLDDFRVVHRRHGDSEQPFALLETHTIAQLFRGQPLSEVAKKLDPAFHAFNSSRKNNLKLHPGVRETLEQLYNSGVMLVAHTVLFHFFQKVYCRERSYAPHPLREGSEWLERVPKDRVVELSHHQSKPDPAVLLEICARQGVDPNNASYVGDSIARDILMAKRSNVFSIWAAYGAQHDPNEYAKLVRISHWTAEEVKREEELKAQARDIRPDYVAAKSFAEVLDALNVQSTPTNFAKTSNAK